MWSVFTAPKLNLCVREKLALKESFADFRDGELLVYQMNIAPYEQGNIYNQDPLRARKLLLQHKRELLASSAPSSAMVIL